jgi:hypothetical protein
LGPPKDLALLGPLETTPPSAGETVSPPAERGQGPHRVELTLKANCFTRFFKDNDPPEVVILEPGPPVVFEAQEKIKIELSNPSGVTEVKYNGKVIDYKPTCYPWWLNFPPGLNDNPCSRKNP